MNWLNIIDGHKTQIMSIITLLAGYSVTHNWIPKDSADLVLSILGILLTAAIAHHEAKKKASS